MVKADISRRLQEIAAGIKEVEAERRRHDPLLLIEPWCIINGEIEVTLFSDQTKTPMISNMISIEGAIAAAKAAAVTGVSIQLSMVNCIEWLHCRIMADPVYTARQKEVEKEERQEEYAAIRFLYEDKAGKELYKLLQGLPQTMIFGKREGQTC